MKNQYFDIRNTRTTICNMIVGIANSIILLVVSGGYSLAISMESETWHIRDGVQATRKVGDTLYSWNFSCGGGPCVIGKFIGGDYWIAPRKKDDEVVLLSSTPAGNDNGIEINPNSNLKQGFLSCDVSSYDKDRNLALKLPQIIPKNSSIVKAIRSQVCGEKFMNGCCIDSYDVLTVLETIPEKYSEKVLFRPGFAGRDKKLFTLEDFDFTKIPRSKYITKWSLDINYNEIEARWTAPYIDHYMSGLGDSGRRFSPYQTLPNYGAELSAIYLDDLLKIMSSDSVEKKSPAIIGLLQRGIDLYDSWHSGITWPTGAGQQLGRKPPIVFFAALLRNESIKEEVMRMTSGNGNATQEDGQIRNIPIELGGGGVPIWGDVDNWCSEDYYWSQLFSANQYDGAAGEPNIHGDNKRTCGDPYGWIDGPAGEPGSFYMACCSTGGYIAYALAQDLMGELCYVANDRDLNSYVQRVLTKGVHTAPDPCAPPDPKETSQCKPYRGKANDCLYYEKTWGPDPTKPGMCIKNGTNGTTQAGRFPALDGKKLKAIYYEPSTSKYLRRKLLNNGVIGRCLQSHKVDEINN